MATSPAALYGSSGPAALYASVPGTSAHARKIANGGPDGQDQLGPHTGSANVANYWKTQGSNGGLLKADQKIADDLHISVSQLTPDIISQYSQEEAARADKLPIAFQIMEMAAIAAATGGVGAAAAGAIGGGLAGAAAGGLATGATSGLVSSALNGGDIGKGILTGALTGAVGGGLGSFAGGASNALSNATGLSNSAAGALVKGGIGAATGAVGAAATGGNVGQAALQGGVGGAARAVAGSIFNSGNTINTSNSTVNPPVTKSTVGNPAMSDDYFNTNDFSSIPPVDTGYSIYNPAGDPNSANFNNLGNNYGTDTSLSSLLGGLNPNYQASNDYLNQGSGSAGGGGSTLGNVAGSSASSLIAKLLGGGGGSGGAGGSSALGSLASLFGGGSGLASLLGLAAQTGGNVLNTNAAKGAAGQFANQTHYNPYGVSTNAGNTSFNGTNATSTLSGQGQQMQNNLSSLGNSAAGALQNPYAAGAGGYTGITNPVASQLASTQQGLQSYSPQNFSYNGPTASTDTSALSNNYFNQLQNQDRDQNNKFYQSNLDDQFAKGILSSTAGQYQSQAALGAINQKTLQNQTAAQNFGQQAANTNNSINNTNFNNSLNGFGTNANLQQAGVNSNNNLYQNQLNNSLGVFGAGNNAANQQASTSLGSLAQSLTGQNQLSQQQLQQLGLAGQLGSNASSANNAAYQPSLAANSGSPIGSLLSGLGAGQQQASNNNSLLQLLTQLGVHG